MALHRWPKVLRRVKGKEYVYYSVRFTDPGTGKQKIRYCKSQADANRVFAEISQRLTHGTYHPRADRITVREAASEWRANHLPRVRPTTRANYRAALDLYILPRWGAVKLNGIRVSEVEKWRDDLSDKTGASTVRNALQVLSMVFKAAQRDCLTVQNPVAVVKKPTVRSRRKDALTPEQIGCFLQWLAAEGSRLDAEAQHSSTAGPIWPHRVRAFTYLAAYCGLREGEILGLRWSDVDLSKGSLSVDQQFTHGSFGPVKTESGRRTVALAPEVITTLRSWKLRMGRASPLDLVLPSTKGTPMSASNFLNREFYKALERAGLPRVTAHSLRHTFASALKSAGVPPVIAHEVMGHSNYSTTVKLYGTVTEEAKSVAALAVADKLRTNH